MSIHLIEEIEKSNDLKNKGYSTMEFVYIFLKKEIIIEIDLGEDIIDQVLEENNLSQDSLKEFDKILRFLGIISCDIPYLKFDTFVIQRKLNIKFITELYVRDYRNNSHPTSFEIGLNIYRVGGGYYAPIGIYNRNYPTDSLDLNIIKKYIEKLDKQMEIILQKFEKKEKRDIIRSFRKEIEEKRQNYVHHNEIKDKITLLINNFKEYNKKNNIH